MSDAFSTAATATRTGSRRTEAAAAGGIRHDDPPAAAPRAGPRGGADARPDRQQHHAHLERAAGAGQPELGLGASGSTAALHRRSPRTTRRAPATGSRTRRSWARTRSAGSTTTAGPLPGGQPHGLHRSTTTRSARSSATRPWWPPTRTAQYSDGPRRADRQRQPPGARRSRPPRLAAHHPEPHQPGADGHGRDPGLRPTRRSTSAPPAALTIDAGPGTSSTGRSPRERSRTPSAPTGGLPAGRLPGGTINFDDENLVVPTGGLARRTCSPTGTYYFLAVAYDLCGNHSDDRDPGRSQGGPVQRLRRRRRAREVRGRALPADQRARGHVDRRQRLLRRDRRSPGTSRTTTSPTTPTSRPSASCAASSPAPARRSKTPVAPITVLSDGWTGQDLHRRAARRTASSTPTGSRPTTATTSSGSSPALQCRQRPGEQHLLGEIPGPALRVGHLRDRRPQRRLPRRAAARLGPAGADREGLGPGRHPREPRRPGDFYHNPVTFGIRNTSNAAARTG